MDRIPTEIYSVLSDRRSRNALLRDRRVLRLFERYPELEKIDRDIKICTAERILRILDHPEDEEKYIGRLARLQVRRSKFLEREGIPLNYDEVVPS